MITNDNRKAVIEQVMKSFKIGWQEIKEIPGPTVTLFEVRPNIGVRITKIRNLKDEFAAALGTDSVRVIAPMPNGSVGIEVPNCDRKNVPMADMLSCLEYQHTDMQLPLAIGRRTDNSIFMVDLATMPHLLVAGATGMGKSVGLNVIISSLINKRTPDELKLVLIDPKQVELSIYEEISKPYIVKLKDTPSVITDVDGARRTLDAVCALMDSRYDTLQTYGVRNIVEYNNIRGVKKLPYIVVIIDEYGDLIMQTTGREMEKSICRIAQKARAVGIHMIISTQRPAADIVTGNIKANFPTRIAFRTTTGTDSRVILDRSGAEKLTGKGDMLFFSGGETTRVQCAYISTEEVSKMCSVIGYGYSNLKQTIFKEVVQERQKSGLDKLDEKVGADRVTHGCYSFKDLMSSMGFPESALK